MDFLNRAYAPFVDLFRPMSPGARLAAGLSVAVVLLSMGYLLTYQTALPEVDLMHGLQLSASQLPAMQAAFGKAKLKGYHIRGTSIFVPHGQEADYMAALVAADALPVDINDAERKAVNDSTMFDFGIQHEQRIRVARQEKIANGIRQMPGIATASVLIDVDPRPGGFKEKVLTASVVVTPANTGQLGKEVVLAIRAMVAASIAGLKPENVAITDTNARRTWYGNLEDHAIEADRLQKTAKNPADQPLPKGGRLPDAAEGVAGATFPDIHAEDSSPGIAREMLDWIKQSWQVLGVFVLAFASLLVLRSMFRHPSTSNAKDDSSKRERMDETVGNGPSAVPSPHAERFYQEPGSSIREDLSKLIEDDPDSAANVLRSWIGQVN